MTLPDRAWKMSFHYKLVIVRVYVNLPEGMYTYTSIYREMSYPRSSMYGIFTYIWVIYGVNVGKYTIHGSSGYVEYETLVVFAIW